MVPNGSPSISTGVGRVAEDVSGILLTLCDQVSLREPDIEELVNMWRRRPDLIAAAAYSDTLGVPAIFPATTRKELLALRGDRGARGLITAAGQVTRVSMPSAAYDLDTPDQLERFTRSDRH